MLVTMLVLIVLVAASALTGLRRYGYLGLAFAAAMLSLHVVTMASQLAGNLA